MPASLAIERAQDSVVPTGQAERAYMKGLAHELAHFPAAVAEEKIAQAAYREFGHMIAGR